MATSNVPGDDGPYFATVPFEEEGAAASVEVIEDMVRLVLLGPVVSASITLTRAETRDVAYQMLLASQEITPERN